MKTTMRRLISTVLAMVMLISMFAVTALAESWVEIIEEPEDREAAYGDPVTLSVTAEGENLTYRWYAWLDYGAYPLYDDEHGVEGADTASLTIPSADCRMNDMSFFCRIVSNGDEDNGVDSYEAFVTVSHKAGEAYVYDADEHWLQCECGAPLESAPHEESDCVCGYDPADPVVLAPVILEDEIEYEPDLENGDDAVLYVPAVGLELTYQWYMDTEEGYLPVADDDRHSGATTDTLTVANVQCADEQGVYYCEVSNSVGYAENEDFYRVEVSHYYDQVVSDGFGHASACVCGDTLGTYNHYDTDHDGVCDECEYVFPEGAPKITADPEDVYVENGHEPVTFTVTATGESLTYQWYNSWGEALEDDEHFSGTATKTLTVNSIYDPENAAYDCAYIDDFYCVVTNDVGAVESEYASYGVEHAEVDYAEAENEYFHVEYCVCGGGMVSDIHSDADGDEACDLCDEAITHPFEDVTDPTAWYYKAAVYNRATEIFMGSYGNLNPNDQITRGEMAAVLARLAMTQDAMDQLDDAQFEEFLTVIAEACGTTPVEFTDIEGKFYERHARVAAAFGLINGYEDGTFRGENKITREELATVLVRYLGVLTEGNFEGIELETPVDAYNDADQISDWAEEYVETARSIGLFCGDENGNLNPTAGATRAEVAQTMMRMEAIPGLLFLILVFGGLM